MNAGSFSLHLDEHEGQLWVGCSTAEYTVPQHTELFGFGSGDFIKGSEAQDVMTADGRWVRYFMDSNEALIILEKQRKTPDHLESATFFNKAPRTSNTRVSKSNKNKNPLQLVVFLLVVFFKTPYR